MARDHLSFLYQKIRKKVIIMPRKKKYPKLPNGYGQIRYLGKGRRNPYGVYPPATEEYGSGAKKTPPALCYVSDRMVGLAVLVSYRAGTYKPGDEIQIEQEMRGQQVLDTKFFQAMIADYNKAVLSIESERKMNFEEVFKAYYLDKFGKEYGYKGKKKSMENSMIAAYKNSSDLHDKPYANLRLEDFQTVIDNVSERLAHSSAELVVTLFKQMDKYALANDIIEKGYAQFARIKVKNNDEHGVPFSDDELEILWRNQKDETVEFLLIMCYSGFRISEYKEIEINLQDRYFKGGLKTDAGRDRIVPIHSGIFSLVRNRISSGKLLRNSVGKFRIEMYATLDRLGIEKHTPHDCRHTFSRLCEKYEVRENDRKRMLGHSFGNDITNAVYGHRTLDDLREQIEKIKI